MPRRLKARTREKGLLDIFAITEAVDGTWEVGWEELRCTLLGGLVSRMPRSAYNHLLNGFSSPFVNALGIPPAGALRKLPSAQCDRQQCCTLYQKRICHVGSRKLPWCYEPAGLSLVPAAMRIAGDLVSLWKQEVYVVAIFDDGVG